MSYANLATAYEIINFNVREVRRELEKNGVKEGDRYPKYEGLCYQATHMFIEKMQKSCERRGIPLKYKSIHGEQKHSIRIPSTRWYYQHQWCWVELLGRRYYVDCTCSQFQDLYSDIPDYYISMRKPKWFYSDRSNPAFNGITKWLNQHITITKTFVDSEGDKRVIHDGIIEIIQYDIWGNISDLIRKIIGKEKKDVKK